MFNLRQSYSTNKAIWQLLWRDTMHYFMHLSITYTVTYYFQTSLIFMYLVTDFSHLPWLLSYVYRLLISQQEENHLPFFCKKNYENLFFFNIKISIFHFELKKSWRIVTVIYNLQRISLRCLLLKDRKMSLNYHTLSRNNPNNF